MFLPAVSRALATVTSLRLKLPNQSTKACPGMSRNGKAGSLSCNDPYGLSLLFVVCPSMKHLSIEGSPPPALLQLLGQNITRLDCVMPDLHTEIIEQLHNLLPCLKHLTMKGYQEMVVHGTRTPYFYSLRNLTGVQKLQVPLLNIQSAEAWASFPPNMSELSCAELHQPPPLHTPLQHLRSVSACNEFFTQTELAGLLRGAPGLQHIHRGEEMIEVNVDFAGSSPGDAVFARIVADLEEVDDRWRAMMNKNALSLVFDSDTNVEDLLRAVGDISSFRKVSLEWLTDTPAELFGLLSTSFPHLASLALSNSAMKDEDLFALLDLKDLRVLSLLYCSSLTGQGLTFLCCQLLSLEMLKVVVCQNVSNDEVMLLEAMMRSIGRHTFCVSF